jgi:hypothetical protein
MKNLFQKKKHVFNTTHLSTMPVDNSQEQFPMCTYIKWTATLSERTQVEITVGKEAAGIHDEEQMWGYWGVAIYTGETGAEPDLDVCFWWEDVLVMMQGFGTVSNLRISTESTCPSLKSADSWVQWEQAEKWLASRTKSHKATS